MRALIGLCALGLAGGLAGAGQETFVPAGATTGGAFTYIVERGDSIAALSSRVGIERAVVARENGLGTNAPLAPGRVLTLDNRHIVPAADTEIVVNVPQRMLFHRTDGRPTSGYPIAVGRRDWPTPRGFFDVVAKEQNPAWVVPLSIQEEMRSQGRPVITQMPPGPTNPLGEFWLGLSLPGIGIHGTSAPTSIYRAVTHGCIRLYPDDARELFFNVSTGARGRIVYEPVLIAIVDGVVLLEAHQDIYRISRGDSLAAIRRTLFETDRGESIDWSTARAVLARRDGIAREIGRSARPPQQAEERGQDAGYLPVAPERRQDGRAVSRLIAPPQTPARTSSF
jgi:L,D-transpeptidase ErfK/SrfK